jgi:hypothetical protein
LSTLATLAAAGTPTDAEIERWTSYIRTHPAGDEMWEEIKQGSQPLLEDAARAARDGRPLLALVRLAAAREDLAAAAYLAGIDATARADLRGLEAEWKRAGTGLRSSLSASTGAELDGAGSALARALGEAALLRIRVYYEASLDYGRNTTPDAGLFYLGRAVADQEFVALSRTLGTPSRRPAPALRSLSVEIESLQAELLAAYRPPASVDRHREFISANAALKEARELDAAGLRHGALLRYLQAAQRIAPLQPPPPTTTDRAALVQGLDAAAQQFSAAALDHSVARFFVEAAQADLASSEATAGALAATIERAVLPRYRAALEPATARPAPPDPRVTVTLVRWPYT